MTGRSFRLLVSLSGLAVLVGATARTTSVVRGQLDAPYDLALETSALRTVELIRSGEDPYSSVYWSEPPYWMTIYTPLYHYVVAALPTSDTNPFRTGRLVGLFGMLLAASVLLTSAHRAGGWTLLAVGLFFSMHPVVINTALMKNDSLGLAASVWAVWAMNRSRRSLAWAALCAVLCGTAIACKQSFGAATIACVAHVSLVDRRLGISLASMIGGLLAAGAAMIWSDGFRFCVFEALQNPMHIRFLADQLIAASASPGFLGLTFVMIGVAVASSRRVGPGGFGSLTALYAGSATLLSGVLMLKQGASTNHLIEPMLAWLMHLTWISRSSKANRPTAGRVAGLFIIVVCVGTDLLAVPRMAFSLELDPTVVAAFETAWSDAGGEDARVLVLSHRSPSVPARARAEVNDGLLYPLLWAADALPTDRVERDLSHRRYDLVVVERSILEAPAPLMKGIANALRVEYEHRLRFPNLIVLGLR